MSARSSLILLVVVLILGPVAMAESTDCASSLIIVPDGRFSFSTFQMSTLKWYGVYAQSGHSYTVEFVSVGDNFLNTTKVIFSAISVYGPADGMIGCRGQSSVTVTTNEPYAPAVQNSSTTGPSSRPAKRVSFAAQTGGLYLIGIANLGNLGRYSFRVIDTTMVNPRWSTCGGYFTHWGLLNVSDMMVIGVFKIFDTSGHPLASTQVTLAPGVEQLHTSLASDMNIAPNSYGYATFSHNGPPDALIGDPYMASANGVIIYPSRFERTGGAR